jgi:hypothetical protein
MTILTASTPNHSELTDLQRESCLLNGIEAENHIILPIDDDYPKHPSWFRIRALLDHLPHHEMVMWLDTDAILLRQIDESRLFAGNHILYLSRDRNGINHGVACYRNCAKSRELLWRVYDAYHRFQYHEWHEQAAIQVFAEQYDIGYLPKEIFNAYPEDRTEGSMVLHAVNRSHEERVKLLSDEIERMRRR